MISSLEPVLDAYKPSWMRGIYFRACTLGDNPFEIYGMTMVKQHDGTPIHDAIEFETDVRCLSPTHPSQPERMRTGRPAPESVHMLHCYYTHSHSAVQQVLTVNMLSHQMEWRCQHKTGGQCTCFCQAMPGVCHVPRALRAFSAVSECALDPATCD